MRSVRDMRLKDLGVDRASSDEVVVVIDFAYLGKSQVEDAESLCPGGVPEESVQKHRRPVRLQSQWCSGCTSIVHVAQWFFAFPIKAHVFLLSPLPSRARRARPPV